MAMVIEKELWEVLVVNEKPTAGDNHHLYVVLGGTTQAPTYSLWMYKGVDGWKQIKYAAET